MKAFFEEYGLSIIIAVAILLLVCMSTPVGKAISTSLINAKDGLVSVEGDAKTKADEALDDFMGGGVTPDSTDETEIKNKITSDDNKAIGKTATASSTITPTAYQAWEAIDGNLGSMWGSATSGTNEWIAIDLGSVQKVKSVCIVWEGAYSKKYRIEASDDGENYTTLRTVEATKAETVELGLPAGTKCRYIRMYSEEAGTGWEMKIFEIGIF